MKFKRVAMRAVLALAGIVALSSASVARVTGPITYAVVVKTSFGTRFMDCFAFDGAGNLTVAGLGTLAYTELNQGNASSRFQSVSPLQLVGSLGFSIAFSGIALGDSPTVGYMRADGLSDQGNSYTVFGPAVASCPAIAKPSGKSPFQR